MLSLDAAVVARSNPLLRELQQGRKMRSLDSLMNKLDEDQNRHVEHGFRVEEGMMMVHTAQAIPTLITGSGCSTASSPQKLSHVDQLRQQVAAARVEQPSSRLEPLLPLEREVLEGNRSVSDSQVRPKDLAPLDASLITASTKTPLDGSRNLDESDQAIAPPPGPPGTASPTIRHRNFKKAEAIADGIAEGPGCRLAEQKEPTLLPHEGIVNSVAMTADGKMLVAGGDDNTLVLWDVGAQARRWEASMSASINVVACAPYGSYAACSTADSNLIVWHLSTKKCVWCRAMDSLVTAIVFHPTSDALCIAESNFKVSVVSPLTSNILLSLDNGAPASSLSFSPDGNLLAIGGSGEDQAARLAEPRSERVKGYPGTNSPRSIGDGQSSPSKAVGLKIYEMALDSPLNAEASCKEIGLDQFDSSVSVVAFSPSGEWLAVGVCKGRSRIALLACADGFKEVMELFCRPGICCISWLPNSRALFSGGGDGQLNFWCITSPTSQQLIPQLPEVGGCYRSIVCCRRMECLASCADGDRHIRLNRLDVSEATSLIAPSTMSGERRQNDQRIVAEVLQREAKRTGVVPHSEKRLPVTLEENRDRAPDEQQEQKISLTAPLDISGMRSVGTVKFSKQTSPTKDTQNKTLAVPASRPRSPLRLGLGSSGIQITVEKAPYEAVDTCDKLLAEESGRWYDLSTMLGVSAPRQIARSSGRDVLGLAHDDEVLAVAFSPDGSTLIAGGHDAMVVLWDIASGSRIMEAPMGSTVRAVAFDGDGRYCAAGEEDSRAHVWTVDSVEEVGNTVVEGQVLSIAMSAKSAILAVGTTAKKVFIFDIPDFNDIAVFMHDAHVHALAFSPDGGFLAGGGGKEDGQHGMMTPKCGKGGSEAVLNTIIWRISGERDEHEHVGTIAFSDSVHVVAFSPCGSLLACGGEFASTSLFSVNNNFNRVTKLNCAAGVRCLAWTNDSQFLASGGEDSQITVWHLLEQRVAFKLPKAMDWYCGVSFNAQNSFLATCGFGSNEITLHPVDVAASTKDVKQVAPEAQTLRAVAVTEMVNAPQPAVTSKGKSGGLMRPVDKSPLTTCGTVKFGKKKGDDQAPAPTEESDQAPESTKSRSQLVHLGDTTSGFHIVIQNSGSKPQAGNLKHHIPHKGGRRSVVGDLAGFSAMLHHVAPSKGRESRTLKHKEDVMDIAFSPDGKYIIAGGEDGILVVWDLETGQRRLDTKLNGSVKAVAYSPRGSNYMAAGDEESFVYVWHADSCEELGMQAVDGQVLSIALDSHPDLLAVGTTAKKVILMSLPSMEEIADLRHDGDVHSLSFSGDGGLLAGGGGTDDMHGLMTHKLNSEGHAMKTVVWQVSEKKGANVFLGSLLFDDIVRAVAFCPAGKLLAVGSEGCTIAMLAVGNSFERTSELKCPAGVRCLSWSADSRFLASGGEDLQISVWDLISEQVIFQFPKVNDWYCTVAFSPNTDWIAACGFGCSSVVLHPIEATEDELQPLEDNDDNDEAEEESPDPVISVVQVSPPEPEKPQRPQAPEAPPPKKGAGPLSLRAPKDRSPLITSGTVKFTAPGAPGAATLAAGQTTTSSPSMEVGGGGLAIPQRQSQRRPSRVLMGSMEDGFQIKVKTVGDQAEATSTSVVSPKSTFKRLGMRAPKLKHDVSLCRTREALTLAHQDEVMGLAFSPDGKTIVAGGEDCHVVLWDVVNQTRKMDNTLQAPIKCVAYSPNGKYIAAGDDQAFVWVWDATTFEEIGCTAVEGTLLSLAFSSNPCLVAAGTTNKKVALFSVPALEEIADLQHDGDVHTVTFSPDGGLLAGGGGTDEMHGLMTHKGDGHAMKTVVWQVSAIGEQCKYMGNITFSDIVHAVAFSPSGDVLAVGGESKEISFLSVEHDFAKKAALSVPAGVMTLSWSRDSCFLASGGEDMQITVWNLLTDSVVFKLPKANDWYCGVGLSPSMEWIATCGFGYPAVTLHPISFVASSSAEQESGDDDEEEEEEEEPETNPDAPKITIGVPSISVGGPTAPTISIGVPNATETIAAPTITIGVSNATETVAAPTITIAAPENKEDAKNSAPMSRKKLSLAAPRDKSAMMSMGTIKFNSPKKAADPETEAPDVAKPEGSSLMPVANRQSQRRPSKCIDDLSGGFEIKVKNAEVSTAGTLKKTLKHQKSIVGELHGNECDHDYMQLIPNAEPRKLKHGDEVLAIAFGPDGDSVVAGSEDCHVVLWDVEHKHKVMEATMNAPVKAVAFSPDGRYIAAGDDDGFVSVYRCEAEICEEVGTTTVDGKVLSIALCSHPDLLAVGTDSKRVFLFSMPKLVEIVDLRHDGDVNSLSFSGDGTMLAGGGGTDDMHGLMTKKLNSEGHNMKVVIWRVSDKHEDCQLLGSLLYEDVVRAVAFSPCSTLIAVGDESRMISMLVVGKNFERASELPCPAGVRCLSWSADSRFLASGGEDMQISVWDLLQETVLFRLPKTNDWYCGVAFSPTNNWLATCGYGCDTVTLYPIEGGIREEENDDEDQNEGQSEAPPQVVAIQLSTGDGNASFNLPQDNPRGHTHIQTPRDRQSLLNCGTVKFSAPPVQNASAQSDGKASGVSKVTLGQGQFAIKVSDTTNHALDHNPHPLQSIMRELHGSEMQSFYIEPSTKKESLTLKHKDELAGLAFSVDGAYLVVGGEDCEVVIWDISTRTRLMEVTLPSPIKSVAYCPGGKFVAAGTEDRTVRAWSTSTKEEVGEAVVEGLILSVALAPRSGANLLAVGTTAKNVALFSLPDFQEIAHLQHDGHVHSIAFSPCGQMLAGGGGTDDMHGLITKKLESEGHAMKTVIWKVASEGEQCSHLGSILFDDIVHAVAFAPCGELLACGSESGKIALLLVNKNFHKTSDLNCAAGVLCLDWSPDSHFLVSAGEDMQISVWDLLTEQVVLQLPKVKDWYSAVAFSPARISELWLASCGFGSGEVSLFPVSICKAEGALPRRRISVGNIKK